MVSLSQPLCCETVGCFVGYHGKFYDDPGDRSIRLNWPNPMSNQWSLEISRGHSRNMSVPSLSDGISNPSGWRMSFLVTKSFISGILSSTKTTWVFKPFVALSSWRRFNKESLRNLLGTFPLEYWVSYTVNYRINNPSIGGNFV